MLNISQPLFPIGRLVATSNALSRLAPEDIDLAIQRHASGDWGEVDEDDRLENERSLNMGLRLMSVYSSRDGQTFWIITEWDRSTTTVLLPEDY